MKATMTNEQRQERTEDEQRHCRQCGLKTPADLLVDEGDEEGALCLDCSVENARDRMAVRLGFL